MPMVRRNDWTFRVLLSSDRHIDSPDSDWDLQKQHLQEAAETGSPVLDCGDLFDIVCGKSDKRASKSGVKPEHNSSTYIDDVIEDTAEKLAPWAHLFPVMLSGNHEQYAIDKLETSMMDRLVERLRVLTGAKVHHGGYAAAVTFVFVDDNKRPHSINLWMEHGAGGGAPVTGDMISMYRRATYLPDFHVACSGHTHDRVVRSLQRLRRTQYGKLVEDELILVKLPSYKREFQGGHGGWHARRGAPPKPVGAAWLEFRWCRRSEKVLYRVVAT